MGGVAHVDAGISSSRSRGSISSLEQPRARFKPSKITARERASWPPSPASTILRLPACLPACLPAATLRMGRCLGQGGEGRGGTTPRSHSHAGQKRRGRGWKGGRRIKIPITFLFAHSLIHNQRLRTLSKNTAARLRAQPPLQHERPRTPAMRPSPWRCSYT